MVFLIWFDTTQLWFSALNFGRLTTTPVTSCLTQTGTFTVGITSKTILDRTEQNKQEQTWQVCQTLFEGHVAGHLNWQLSCRNNWPCWLNQKLLVFRLLFLDSALSSSVTSFSIWFSGHAPLYCLSFRIRLCTNLSAIPQAHLVVCKCQLSAGVSTVLSPQFSSAAISTSFCLVKLTFQQVWLLSRCSSVLCMVVVLLFVQQALCFGKSFIHLLIRFAIQVPALSNHQTVKSCGQKQRLLQSILWFSAMQICPSRIFRLSASSSLPDLAAVFMFAFMSKTCRDEFKGLQRGY